MASEDAVKYTTDVQRAVDFIVQSSSVKSRHQEAELVTVSPENISAVTALGFDCVAAEYALRRCRNRVEPAVEWFGVFLSKRRC